MKQEFFANPAIAPRAAEEELNGFIAGHRVLSMERQLIADGAALWELLAAATRLA